MKLPRGAKLVHELVFPQNDRYERHHWLEPGGEFYIRMRDNDRVQVFTYRPLWSRIKDAWRVLTGAMDKDERKAHNDT
jgi:hypothetical protein